MSLQYSAGFVSFGVLLAVWSVQAARSHLWCLVLLYPSASLFLVGIAYGCAGPGMLGKRPNGQRSWTAILWTAPYITASEALWWPVALLTREPTLGLATTNLYFGRRLSVFDGTLIAEQGFQSCLDLTSEFSEVKALRDLKNYRCLPVLDGMPLSIEQLHDAIGWLGEAVQRGPVYVHCALGHGRTGMVVAAYLVAHRLEPDIDGALKRLRDRRSGVSLNRRQRHALTEFVAQIQLSQLAT